MKNTSPFLFVSLELEPSTLSIYLLDQRKGKIKWISQKSKQDFGANQIYLPNSPLKMNTTCYFFHSLPFRISRGLIDSTKSLDEFLASSKCVKDHSRT